MSLQSLLDEQDRPARTNSANDGRAFQKEIEVTVGGYNARRVASLRKVDPPVRIIWPYDPVTKQKKQRVIFQENPFLDYIGVWTERGGRTICLEAKSTSNHRLPFQRDGGLTETQWRAMKNWRSAGAATALVWQFAGRVVLFTPEMLVAQEGAGAKSLLHESGIYVSPGIGNVLWDFLGALERELWPDVASGR